MIDVPNTETGGLGETRVTGDTVETRIHDWDLNLTDNYLGGSGFAILAIFSWIG